VCTYILNTKNKYPTAEPVSVKKSNNIVLDFTANQVLGGLASGQDLAVMPASIAKRLLDEYASRLSSCTAEEIISPLTYDLNGCNNVAVAERICLEFLQERAIVKAITSGNTDIFKKVKSEKAENEL